MMNYELISYMLLAFCGGLIIISELRKHSLRKDVNRWQDLYLKQAEENNKFLMMNKNETAYHEATRREIGVDEERQSEINNVHRAQLKHDEIFQSGVISEAEMAMYSTEKE